jgi:hypothetical protein
MSLNVLKIKIMFRTILLVSIALIATGVLASFKSNQQANDQLGV